MHVKLVVAHHPYEAARDDELSFAKGEVLKVTDDSDPDWWVGKKQDGAVGYFPSNFVELKEDNEESMATPHTPPSAPVPSATNNSRAVEEAPAQPQTLPPPPPSEPAPAPPVMQEEEPLADKPIEGQNEEVPITADKDIEEEDDIATEEQPDEKKVDRVIAMARVMEDYAMQDTGEISLSRGGIVNIYEKLDAEWSRGELNGRVGRFPTKYVEEIDMPGRPDLGRLPSSGSGGMEALKGDEESPSAPRGGFKLAAYGVKQGGIGSLLAGGIPTLKKTKPVEEKKDSPVSSPTPAPAPALPAHAVPPASAKQEEQETKPSSGFERPVSAVPAVPAFTATESSPSAPVTRSEPAEKKQPSLGKAIVLHPYDAANDDELTLLRGEYVEILNRHADDGWWQGRNEKGEMGVFPSNFVKELEEDHFSPPTPVRSRQSVTSSVSSNPSAAPSAPAAAAMAKPPPVPRSNSIQSSATSSRPTSIDQKPTPSSSIPTEKQMEEAIKEEEQYEADEEKPNSPMRSEIDSPAFTPNMGQREVPAHPPTSNPPTMMEQTPQEPPREKLPPVIPEDPISDDEVKESGVDEFANAQEEEEFFDVHDDAAAAPPMTVADTLMARLSPRKTEFDLDNKPSADELTKNSNPASPQVDLSLEKDRHFGETKDTEQPQERAMPERKPFSEDVKDLETKDKSIEDLVPAVKDEDSEIPMAEPLKEEKGEKKPSLSADNNLDNDKPKDRDISPIAQEEPIIETPGLTEESGDRDISTNEKLNVTNDNKPEQPTETPIVREMAIKEQQPTTSTLEEEPVSQPTVTEPVENERSAEPEKSSIDEAKPATTEAEDLTKETPRVAEEESSSPSIPVNNEGEPVKKTLDSIPTTGPRLTSPSRVRPAGARRSPLLTKESQEPSQMELLKKELDAAPEDEKKETPYDEPSPSSTSPVEEKEQAKPAKPIKPIFAKFPTPFAASGSQEELVKRNLRPTTGGRRLWDPQNNNGSNSNDEHDQDHKENESSAPRPTGGVKSIASRFNFSGGSGGNEVLETKLKNYTKNEVDKLRKEVQEEREKRMQLEEKLEALETKLNALLG